MMLNMFKCSIPLVHAPVLYIGKILGAYQVAIHNSHSPKNIRGFRRSCIHLDNNPKKGRRHKPQKLPQSIQVKRLKGSVISGGDNDKLFSSNLIIKPLFLLEIS
ncbi:hypothetical protein HanHA300_Chr10g0344161 [Helianthus annuus]|nr:hypothetical protein HanHA300_Chr10g0344161 [Helianthus annuus]KAJ0528352.1 hypothetical protein HanHA89_Chr10g0365381 [Helianthus annuus]